MTPNKEDYLKMIFELGGTEMKVNNKQIVEGMNVSAASVSEMMTKLLKEGYIERTPYQGVQLTEDGLRKASKLVRKHRLWEVFLVEHLGYSWNDVHQEAEILEHVSSMELTNRLDAYLEYPQHCPHGGMIPKEDGIVAETEREPLSEKKHYQRVKIQRVLDEKDLLDYLVSIGIDVGDVYQIVNVGEYEGPITLESSGKQIQISHKAAAKIFIENV